MIEEKKYLHAYFGRQSDYYSEKYKAHHSGDQFTFNIAAFLAGLFWFLYRKLYIQAIMILLILFIIGMIEGVIYELFAVSDGLQSVIYFLSVIAFGTVYGFIGNSLYIRQAERRIKKILSGTEDEDRRIKLLRKSGGVSWTPYIVIALLIVLLFITNNM